MVESPAKNHAQDRLNKLSGSERIFDVKKVDTSFSNTGFLNGNKQKGGNTDSHKLATAGVKASKKFDLKIEDTACASEFFTKCVKGTGRKDVAYKSAIRLLKRFYKNIFKNKNLEIVKRRYVNCSQETIFSTMKSTLAEILPEEEI